MKKHDLVDVKCVISRAKNIAGITTDRELSKIIGISSADFGNRKKRGTLLPLLINWAANGNVDLNYLIKGQEEKEEEKKITAIEKPSEFDRSKIEYIPMSDTALSAGGGAFADYESIRDYYAFKKDWLIRTVTAVKNAVLVGVIGNSMEPTIKDGDAVMLDVGRTHLYDGNIYALRLDGTVMIKRLSVRPNDQVKIISDNSLEHESYIAERKNIHIIGQVVWYARSLVRTE